MGSERLVAAFYGAIGSRVVGESSGKSVRMSFADVDDSATHFDTVWPNRHAMLTEKYRRQTPTATRGNAEGSDSLESSKGIMCTENVVINVGAGKPRICFDGGVKR